MVSLQGNHQYQAHQDQMFEHLRLAIRNANGWLPFDKYMQEVLYAPNLGYYSNGLQKFGDGGDFVTAPELGEGFARCIAKQCSQVLSEEMPNIFEFGAGSGALMVAVLIELAALKCLPEQYFIVELSQELRTRQKEIAKTAVPELMHRIVWLETLPEEEFRGCVIANEVLDAMPVKLVERNELGETLEIGVIIDATDRGLVLNGKLADEKIASRFGSLLDSNNINSTYRSEIGQQGEAWVKGLGGILHSGLVLLVDYGFNQSTYYHPDRVQGTVMCHYQHKTHDNPLLSPGLQDITAHVNFTAIADAALSSGFQVSGYAPQGHFLLALGLLEQSEETDSLQKQLTRSQEIKKLTMPHEMGELFKVLALTKNVDQPLWGFSQLNHAERLWT